ncbi:MAG: hypothetical protein O2865_08975 [Planctomycetota bacterium]|nr:hypothetical protein [Planctomycetota bacterium]MDA0933871.1 hypothetical protein [Planctomycetota bacterium]
MSKLPALATSALLTSCIATDGGADGAVFERVVIAETGVKLGGCAVGDLDPSHEGPEIAAVGEDGSVHVAWREDGSWRSAVVARCGGEMIQCAIGDADLDHPGVELVVVGMQQGPETDDGPGAAHLIRWVDGAWTSELLLVDDALLHAASVGEGEVFVAGFTERVHRLRRRDGGFKAAVAIDLPGAAKCMIPFADGVAVACTDGSVVHMTADARGYTGEVLDRRLAGRARLGTDGTALAVADDDGVLSLVTPGASTVRLHRASEKARGAVLADLDPSVPGPEAATVGYDRRVMLLRGRGEDWDATQLSREEDRLHHLVHADVDPAPGDELLTVGFAGDVVMFRRVR